MNYTVSNTKEIALEQAIERHLTGTTTEDLKDGGAETGPYRIGRSTDFDAALALDTDLFWEFLEATQGKALEKLKTRNPADWQAKILGQFGAKGPRQFRCQYLECDAAGSPIPFKPE